MSLSSYQNEVLMCRCPFKGKSLVAHEGEGGFRSGATHFSSKGEKSKLTDAFFYVHKY